MTDLDAITLACEVDVKEATRKYVLIHYTQPNNIVSGNFSKELAHIIIKYAFMAQKAGYGVTEVIDRMTNISMSARREFNEEIKTH